MVQKLPKTNLSSYFIQWVFNYLTNRTQLVPLNGTRSAVVWTNTGAPQGAVLAPFLFAVYTADCRQTDSTCP